MKYVFHVSTMFLMCFLFYLIVIVYDIIVFELWTSTLKMRADPGLRYLLRFVHFSVSALFVSLSRCTEEFASLGLI